MAWVGVGIGGGKRVKNPLFSIVIPIYNVAQYLHECLDSLLAQTFTDWEAICVDDGSADGSGQILDEYAAHDARIRVVHQPNAGVSIARNNGLSRVKGDYIGFVDADDVLGRDWLKAAADAIEATNADIVKMRLRRDSKFNEYVKPSHYQTYRGADIYSWSVLNRGLTVLNFYRGAVLSENVRFPEGMRIYEDGIFNLYALLSVRTGVQCEYDGYYYRMSETSSFRKRVTEEENVRFIQECVQWFVTAKTKFPNNRAAEIAVMRIRSHISSHLMEWVQQPESTKGNRKMIASAIRGAEKAMGVTLVPVGGLCGPFFGLFYAAYYHHSCYWALKVLNSLQNLRVRLKRIVRR